MLLNLFQPIRFFPRLDSQYFRYIQKKLLQYQEMKALWFFIDRMDHYGIIACKSDWTITKSLCDELEITDQHNCRAIIRKLISFGLIKKIAKDKFKLNPYVCNRIKHLAPALTYGFTDVRQTEEYKIWKTNDDRETKNFPSLKRRLHNAVFRAIKPAVEKETHPKDDAMNTKLNQLQDQLSDLQQQMRELISYIKQDDLPKAKSYLTLIEGGKKD